VIVKAEVSHRLFGWFGYGGAGATVAVLPLTEIELTVRIIAGVLSGISIIVHLCWSWSDRKKKKK
jgi:hypothetical protein